MIIAACGTWVCGPFTVRAIVRHDNPAFARYLIMRGQKIVGVSFSMPNKDWCEAIERITSLGRYVEKSAPIKRYSYRLRGAAKTRNTRRPHSQG